MDTPCPTATDDSIHDWFDHRADDGRVFATLALSRHLGIPSLTQLLSIGIGFMVAANVMVLPAILALFDS